MTTVNGPIRPKRSTVAGEIPGIADLVVGEVAVNTADGKLFTKHTDDSIKTVGGGEVESVNGEIGAVSLGIQDMDDFALLLSPGSTWNHSSDNSNNADLTDSGATNGKVTTDQDGASYNQYTLWVGDVDSNGINRKADMLQAITDGAVLSVYYDGVLAFTDTVTSPGGSANQYGRVALSFAGGNFFFPPSVGTTVGLALPGSPALPLVADDMLKWDNAEQAFRPTQLATVAASGSYNDLTDQPTIPTILVDSVNGETGAVSLGIQDMDDYELRLEILPGLVRNNAVFDQDGTYPADTWSYFTSNPTTAYIGVSRDGSIYFDDYPVNDPIYIERDGVTYEADMQSVTLNRNKAEFKLRSIADYNAIAAASGPLTVKKQGTTEMPLADGDILQWYGTDSKFKPQQLATVATSGDYNDLSDQPTIPTSIQDMNDFEFTNVFQSYRFTPGSSANAGEYVIGSFIVFNSRDADGQDFAVGGSDDFYNLADGQTVYIEQDGQWFSTIISSFNSSGSIRFAAGGLSAIDNTKEIRLVSGFFVNSSNSLELPPANDDVLSWSDADQAFKPGPIATVARSGSYNDLADLPVLINRIQDQADYQAGFYNQAYRFVPKAGASAANGEWDMGSFIVFGQLDADGQDFAVTGTSDFFNLADGQTVYVFQDGQWFSTVISSFNSSSSIRFAAGSLSALDTDKEILLVSENFVNSSRTIGMPPADNQLLKWSDADAKWTPAPAPVDSVNGETGAVSLGIQDMDDFAPFSTPPAGEATWDYQSGSGTPASGNYTIINTTQLRLENNGASSVMQYTPGDPIWIAFADANDGAFAEYEVSSFNYTTPYWTLVLTSAIPGTGNLGELSTSQTDPGASTPVALVDGEILRWNNTDQKFKPATLATVATSGDYDDLNNKPTITAAPVDSVNGETGVVSLGIQEMDDFILNEDTSSLVSYTFNQTSGQFTMSNGSYWSNTVLYIAQVDNVGASVPGTGLAGESYWWRAVSDTTWNEVVLSEDISNTTQNGTPSWALRGSNPPSVNSLELTFTDPDAIQYLALAEDDILQWDDVVSKFKPAQLATVATSGSYNDLTDLPAGGGVDSVNGETGAVSLDVQDMGDFAYNKTQPVAYRYNAASSDTGAGGAWIRTDLSNYTIYLHEETADGVNIAAELATKRAEVPGSIWFSADGVNGWTEFPYINTDDTGTGNVLSYFAADGTTAPLPTTGADVYFSLSDPAQLLDVPLADGDVLRWIDVDQKFKPYSGYISLATLKAEVAASTDFADFQSRIAAL